MILRESFRKDLEDHIRDTPDEIFQEAGYEKTDILADRDMVDRMWGLYQKSIEEYDCDADYAYRDAIEAVLHAKLPHETTDTKQDAYFFCMTVCHRRTGAPLGKRCGVVFADSDEHAERTAWEKYGGDAACKLWVERVPDGRFDFTVYKSEI